MQRDKTSLILSLCPPNVLRAWFLATLSVWMGWIGHTHLPVWYQSLDPMNVFLYERFCTGEQEYISSRRLETNAWQFLDMPVHILCLSMFLSRLGNSLSKNFAQGETVKTIQKLAIISYFKTRFVHHKIILSFCHSLLSLKSNTFTFSWMIILGTPPFPNLDDFLENFQSGGRRGRHFLSKKFRCRF